MTQKVYCKVQQNLDSIDMFFAVLLYCPIQFGTLSSYTLYKDYVTCNYPVNGNFSMFPHNLYRLFTQEQLLVSRTLSFLIYRYWSLEFPLIYLKIHKSTRGLLNGQCSFIYMSNCSFIL